MRDKLIRLLLRADRTGAEPFLRELIAMALYRLNRGELPFDVVSEAA